MTGGEATAGDTRSARAARIGACAVVAVVAGLDAMLALGHASDALALVALITFETLLAAVVGLLVVWVHPRHVVGWLLLAHGLLVALVLAPSDTTPPDALWARVVTQLMGGGWCLLYVCIALLGYLFPDGRFLSRRWRRWVVGCLVGYGVFVVAASGDVSSYRQQYPGGDLPLPVLPDWVRGPLGAVGLLAIAASLVGAVVCARARLRAARGDDRLRMLWFATAALSIPAALLVCWIDYWVYGGAGTLTVVGVTVFGSVIPVAIGIAILRHRLFDIELVLSRTLTYGVLTLLVVATYAGILTVSRALVGDSGAGLLAVGLVAVAIQPVHSRVRRRAERWVYGDRSDPYGALRRLADRLEAAADPAGVVQTVTSSVAEALRLDHVTVTLDPTELPPRGDHGTAGRGEVVGVPLTHRGERLGTLLVELQPGRRLGPDERSLLDELARHAGTVVHAVHLSLALQRSRAELVSAQAEERRRLRRDLHDGLGPTLAAIVLKLGAVGARVDDPAAARLLTEVREEAKEAIGEIRRVVDGLRPPALDEVGLVAALRQHAAALSRGGLVVAVEGPEHLPALPAAVEVAAYRIVTEALTNVVRHAGATRAVVRMVTNGGLALTVEDNGTGGPSRAEPGVGWTSMRERAAELGGSCTVTRRTEGGVVVRAVLPLSPVGVAQLRTEPA